MIHQKFISKYISSTKILYRIINNFLMVQLDYDTLAYASLGGLILGIATSLNYIIRGKVTGMSGIVYGIISYNKCTHLLYQ